MSEGVREGFRIRSKCLRAGVENNILVARRLRFKFRSIKSEVVEKENLIYRYVIFIMVHRY